MTIATVLINPYWVKLDTLNIDYRNHSKHVNTSKKKKNPSILFSKENRQVCIINAPLRPEPISDLY